MARLSFEQFSSGLPVRRQSEIDQETQRKQQEATAQPTFMQERKQDSFEMGTALNETAGEFRQVIAEQRNKVESGQVSPAKGAFNTFGLGALKAGEYLGEAGIGIIKQLLPEKVEQRIRDTLGADMAEIFNGHIIEDINKATEGEQKGGVIPGTKELNQKIANSINEVTGLYLSDPQFKDDVDSSIGILGLFEGLRGNGLKSGKPQTSGNIPVKGDFYNPAQSVPITNRTAQQAAEEVVAAANPPSPSSPVTDAVTGFATQVKDFSSRTIKSAQDTAEQSRRIAEMPESRGTLVRYGADERVINVIDQASPSEVKVYRELVEQAKRKEIDPTPNTAQPKQIAGREFLKPVEHIIEARNGAGARLGKFREGLSSAKNVNTNPAFRNFHQNLKDKYGLQFDTSGKIIKGKGILPDKDIAQVQKLYDELRSKTITSQRDIDEFLRRSLEEFDITQQREKAFSSMVSEIAESARYEMRQLMPDGYNRAATQYAQLSKPLEETAKLLGYKGKVADITAKDLKAGEVALRILGNAADRPQSVIDEVLRVAKENGYTSEIDLNRLIYVTDQLEDLYDITPSRGFSGSTARGIDQSSAGAAADFATMNLGSLYDRVMTSQATRQEVQSAFEDYLKYLDSDKKTSVGKTPSSKVKVLEQEGDSLLKDIEGRLNESSQSSVPDYLRNNKQAGFANFNVRQVNIKKEIALLEKTIKKFETDGVPQNNPTLKRLIAKRNELIKVEPTV